MSGYQLFLKPPHRAKQQTESSEPYKKSFQELSFGGEVARDLGRAWTWGVEKRIEDDWKTWQVVGQGKVRLLNTVNPSRDFWIVYGLGEEEGEEEMKFNRRSPAAKYLIWKLGANSPKQSSKRSRQPHNEAFEASTDHAGSGVRLDTHPRIRLWRVLQVK